MYGLSKVSLCLAGLALVCQDRVAQDHKSPFGLIPDGAVFLAQVDGPARWAERFEKTGLGGMLASPDVSPHIKSAMTMLEATLGPAFDAAGYDYSAILHGFLAYDGRAAIAVGGNFVKVFELDPTAKLDTWAVVVLPQAGGPKLAPAVKELVQTIEDTATDLELRDLEVEGRTLRYALPRKGMENAPSLVLPFMVGSDAVLLIADDVGKLARKVLTNKANHYRDFEQKFADKDLAMRVGLEQLFDALFERLDDAASPMAGYVKPFFEGLGITAWKHVDFSLGASGQQAIMDIELQLGPGGRGVLGAAYPPRRGGPHLLDFVPVHRDMWSVAPIDFAGLYRELAKLLDGVSDLTEHSVDELEKMFEDKTKLRLKEDLIDPLGDELLSVQGARHQQPGAGLRPELRDYDAICYGVALRDSAAFGKSFDRLLRSFAMHVSRKTESYGPFKVSRILPFGAFPVYYCVTDELFLIAIGDSGADELRAVLDEVKDRRAGKPRPAMPESVRDRLQYAPDGWHGIGVVSLPAIITSTFDSVRSELGDLMDRRAREQVAGAIDLVVKLLRAHKLDHMVSVSKVHGGRVLSRMIW